MNDMQIICNANTGRIIPVFARLPGESDETRFTPLIIGEKYIVYGLMFMCKRIDYLICPDSNGPCWMPGNLFEVTEPFTPRWEICLADKSCNYRKLFMEFGITALLGYDKLVNSYEHYEGILERNPIHLYEFFVHKKVMDEEVACGNRGGGN
ncbi:MAG: hypothetical protein K8F30_01050 [Taibaiella sp.]|nr:hypothetical protein [Taibaiella sp.]